MRRHAALAADRENGHAGELAHTVPQDLAREIRRLLAQILVEDVRAYPTLPQEDTEFRVTSPRQRNPGQEAQD